MLPVLFGAKDNRYRCDISFSVLRQPSFRKQDARASRDRKVTSQNQLYFDNEFIYGQNQKHMLDCWGLSFFINKLWTYLFEDKFKLA